MEKVGLQEDKLAIDRSGKRPDSYDYLKIIKDYLGGDQEKIFSGKLVYPRQLEIHLPGDHKRACDFNCYYCQGGLLKQPLALDEKKVLKLLEDIGEGKFEYYIFGGAYTEPLLNPYLLDFIRMAKKNKVNFGIHTSGSRLKELEEKQGFLTEIFQIMDKRDYVSVSLDAGTPQSHMKIKNLDRNYFDNIMEGIRMMSHLSERSPEHPAVRVCYLLNRHNSSEKEIEDIISMCRILEVDSLRFSIPYDQYGKSFEKVRHYKRTVELPEHEIYEKRLQRYISENNFEKPYIFYFPPVNQDVDLMNFKQCVYCYYQITIASDGNVYRCSSIASPSFDYGILGPTPATKNEFEKLILKSQNPNFDCAKCFQSNARCNRLALEVNRAFNNNDPNI